MLVGHAPTRAEHRRDQGGGSADLVVADDLVSGTLIRTRALDRAGKSLSRFRDQKSTKTTACGPLQSVGDLRSGTVEVIRALGSKLLEA
jgi:hypothetical protein